MFERSGLAVRRRVTRAVAAGALAAALLPLATSESASAGHGRAPCERRNNNSYKKLLKCVTFAGVREHQTALQAIADANGGNRAVLTPGYDASVDYVVEQLEDAGWEVEVQDFDYEELVGELQQLTPVMATYESGGYTGSGVGEVTGTVIPVDINLAPPRASSSGCEVSDFAGLNFSGPNDIALIQRGTCFFALKALNAQNAGAEAVIIFNQGNTPDREGLFVGDVSELEDGTPTNITIPVVGAPFAAGQALAQAGSTARVETFFVTRTEQNVIAELRGQQRRQRRDGRRPPRLGARGSGDQRQRQRLGRPDRGRRGARQAPPAEHAALRLVGRRGDRAGRIDAVRRGPERRRARAHRAVPELRHDRLAELRVPGVRRRRVDVRRLRRASRSRRVPRRSRRCSSRSTRCATSRTTTAEFSGRSDYQAFIDNDIPSGGLFTGAEVPKTEEQVEIWGGVADEQFDPCYHAACDTIGNFNRNAARPRTPTPSPSPC